MLSMIGISEERTSVFLARELENTSTSGIITFTTVILNEGGDYDASSGVFTCRIPGLYFFSATLGKTISISLIDNISCWLHVNSSSKVWLYVNPIEYGQDFGYFSASASAALRLQKSDTVYLGGCTSFSNFYSIASSFSGILIQPDDL